MPGSVDPRSRRDRLFRIHSTLRSADGLRPDEAFDELVRLYRVWVKAGGEEPRAAAWDDAGLSLSRGAIAAVQPALWELLGEATDGLAADLFQELADVGVRSGLGQYFTPNPVASAMAAYLAPKAGEHWMDPFVGSGLLVGHAALAAGGPVSLYGTDLDERVLTVAELEATLRHPESPFRLARLSALTDRDELLEAVGAPARGLDGIVTNPPFGSIDLERREDDAFELAQGASTPLEVLGLEQSLRLLRPGGRMGIVLPQSVLSNKRLERVRRYARDRACIDGVLSLPAEAFAMYEGVGKASVLFLTAKAGTRQVWFGRASSVGWDSTGRAASPEDVGDTARSMRDGVVSPGAVESRDGCALMDRNLTAEWHLRAIGDGIPLSDLCEAIFTGRTPSRASYGPKTEPGALRVVKVADLTGHGLDWSEKGRSYAAFKRHPAEASFLRVGDLVLTSSAHHPRYIAAKVDLVDTLPVEWERRCVPAGEVMVLRPDPSRVEPAALLLWLRSEEGRSAMQACVTGQTAHLHPDYVGEVRVPTLLQGDGFERATSLLYESLATRRAFETLERDAVAAFAELALSDAVAT